MEYIPTEEQLQKWGKPIIDSLNGFTREDLEPLFEKYVLPFYYVACTFPKDMNVHSKWKIVNRETGEEYDRKEAFKRLKMEGLM
ncbi:hypothetical protein [Flavobacterium sp. IMCC34518]|uniref:hypothetical protein n=1 Tax=Flavobacterium sp. IMCC34518 TaxID=3003623 RepID=UPI0022AC5C30|nr:hypothetical protein [Flavobacterium sp. IMCC34518]